MPVRHRFVTAAALTALLSAPLAMTGCATDRSVISKANQQNDTLEPTIIDDAQVDAYMQKLGARIVAAAKEQDEQGVGPKAHKNGEDNS